MNILIYTTADITNVFLNAVKEQNNSNIKVVGVYSRDIKKAKEYALKNNIDNYYDDYDKALENEGINTVYVASPNSLHYDVAKKALNAKKHAIVEKPIALKASEVNELYEVAKKNGVYVFDALKTVYMQNVEILKQMLKDETVHLIDFHYSKQTRHFKKYEEGQYFNVFDSKMGGGALNDLGVYLIYPLVYLFSSDIKSFNVSILNDLDCDESSLIAGTVNDSLFTIRTSKVVDDKRDSVICTKNFTVYINDINNFTNIKIVNHENEVILELNNNNCHMYEEVHYFYDVISKNREFDYSIKDLSISVLNIINGEDNE